MSESKIALDRYKKAKDEAEHNISILLSNEEKIKDETEYALIHLKEYINLYKIQVNYLYTTKRKKAICDKILNLFPKADPNIIKSYLRKKLVFDYFDFLIFVFPLIVFGIFYFIKSSYELDLVDVIGVTVMSSIISIFVLSFILTETSLIRIYPLRRLKESKNEK